MPHHPDVLLDHANLRRKYEANTRGYVEKIVKVEKLTRSFYSDLNDVRGKLTPMYRDIMSLKDGTLEQQTTLDNITVSRIRPFKASFI